MHKHCGGFWGGCTEKWKWKILYDIVFFLASVINLYVIRKEWFIEISVHWLFGGWLFWFLLVWVCFRVWLVFWGVSFVFFFFPSEMTFQVFSNNTNWSFFFFSLFWSSHPGAIRAVAGAQEIYPGEECMAETIVELETWEFQELWTRSLLWRSPFLVMS